MMFGEGNAVVGDVDWVAKVGAVGRSCFLFERVEMDRVVGTLWVVLIMLCPLN